MLGKIDMCQCEGGYVVMWLSCRQTGSLLLSGDSRRKLWGCAVAQLQCGFPTYQQIPTHAHKYQANGVEEKFQTKEGKTLLWSECLAASPNSYWQIANQHNMKGIKAEWELNQTGLKM